MTHRLVMSLALIASFASVGTLRADVIPVGKTKVRCTSTIDFGPFADLAPTSYVVEEGDTLSELAEKHLGSAKRHVQISALNEGVTAETLKAGQTILLPPKSPDESKWMHFFAVQWEHAVDRADHRKPLPHHHYWTSLWAVPHANLAEFSKGLEGDDRDSPNPIQVLEKKKWLFKAEERFSGYEVLPENTPVKSIRRSYTIVSIGEGTIQLAPPETAKFGKDGKPVDGAGILVVPSNGILLLLGAIGGGALFALAIRRRESPGPARVPAT